MIHQAQFIEIYHADDTLLESISLVSVLIDSVEHIINRRLSQQVTITLLLDSVAAPSSLTGTPALINLTPEYGYATVIVRENGKVIYQHPHSVEELIAKILQEQLRNRYPNESLWKFQIMIPNLTRLAKTHLAPPVAGVMDVKPYGNQETIPFRISRVSEPPLPQAALEDFVTTAITTETDAPVRVLVQPSVYQELMTTHRFSNRVEEGGFLVGRAYQDRHASENYLLQITGALAARYTGASLMHFTYTGDSFMEVKRILREQRPTERLLGWYHTHLFSASIPMGLSSIDWELHFTTFRIPWQVAGLINLEEDKRTLRFYVRHSNLMVPCPWWIVGEF